MKLKVITQTGILFEKDDITSIKVDTELGLIMILPDHQNIVSKLVLGKMEVAYKNSSKPEDILVSGGFFEFHDNQAIVLSDQADLPDSLISEEIEESIAKAKAKIATNLPPSELIQLEKMLRYEHFKKDYIGI